MSDAALPPPTPDLDGLRRCLQGRGTPERVYHFEHGIADDVKRSLAGRLGLEPDNALPEPQRTWQWEAAVQAALGFEIFRVWPGRGTPAAGYAEARQGWEEETTGPIQSLADCEAFDWARPEAVDYRQLEWYEKHLPPEMGLYVSVHVWEQVRQLIGFESFCYKLYEEPELIAAVTERVADFWRSLVRTLCDFDRVFAVYGADDFGYKTGLMLPPETIREHFLPVHAEFAAAAHRHGKLYFLHSCGKLDEIMEDLIEEVGIDAKHSFEDVIEPVTEAKRRWGGRLALLGGLDVDAIARGEEAGIRQYVRDTLRACQPGGGYCLGLGNWVTSYIPPEHYLWVLDEGRRFGRER
jgi:uroporphyrinogen decarboxylase